MHAPVYRFVLPAAIAAVLLLAACDEENATPFPGLGTPSPGATPTIVDGTPGPTPGTPTPTIGVGTPSPTPGGTPSPGVTPTAIGCPTPPDATQPLIEVTSLAMVAGQEAQIEVRALNMPEPGLAGFDIELVFDPSIVRVVSVSEGEASWPDVTANVQNDIGRVNLVGARATGIPGTSLLAVLEVEAVGTTGEAAVVQVLIDRLADDQLRGISADGKCGEVLVQ